MKVALICCAKREELYISEWIDWHRSIGIDHIYIADNNDSGYPIKLQSIVDDYVKDGYVTIYNYNDVIPVQIKCYDEIYQQVKQQYDWIGFIDIDEFIYLNKHSTIEELLSDEIYTAYSVIHIPWRIFDDNGLVDFDKNTGVQKRFMHHANYIKKYFNDVKYFPDGFSNVMKSFIRSKNTNFHINSVHDLINKKNMLTI